MQFVEWYCNFAEDRLTGDAKPALRSVA